MRNVLLSGVGGQGTVLAAKVLAQAAQDKGWQVRTAETIGMAQRGGSVSSHLRIGSKDLSPVVPSAHADVLLAFELAEGARMIPKLSPKAKAVINTDEIIPTNVALKQGVYLDSEYLEVLKKALPKGVFISAAPLALKAGDARTLNVVMLGAATGAGVLPFSVDEMRAALKACIKPKLLKMNEKAFDLGIKEAERWCSKNKKQANGK